MADQTATGVFTRSLYPLGIALSLFPLADIAGRLLPMHLDNLQWRFGAVGLVFGGTLVMMILGLGLVAFVAASRRDANVLTVIAGVAIAIATILLAALVVFGLDALQLRSTIREELRASMAMAAMSAAVGALLTVSALVGLAVAAIRARRTIRSESRLDRTPAVVLT